MTNEEVIKVIAEMTDRKVEDVTEYIFSLGCEALRPIALHFKVCDYVTRLKELAEAGGSELPDLQFSNRTLNKFKNFSSIQLTKEDLVSLLGDFLDDDGPKDVDDFLGGLE